MRLAALILVPLLPGCQFGYVLSQGTAELGILWGARELDEVRTPETSEAGLDRTRRAKLDVVVEVKQFASEEIGLVVGDAYSTYYETDVPISWTVSAAHPTALVPYRWSFPFAGEVTYKGFFRRNDAVQEARRLRQEGWDIHVSPVAAFSTLGWFRDPILSTMLEYDIGDLAELIIHELVHRTVYFHRNTPINESMATVIARAGARLFLTRRFGETSTELRDYERSTDFTDAQRRVRRRLRRDLDALYRASLGEADKLRRKAMLFALASATLAIVQPESRWSSSNDDTAERPRSPVPSNARVLASGQYFEHGPLFHRALEALDGQPRRLMDFMKRIPVSGDPVPLLEVLVKEHGELRAGKRQAGRTMK